MKAILVPAAVDVPRVSFAQRSFVRAGYLQKLIKYGLTPIIATPLLPEQQLRDLFELSAGVLMVGGDDFDAALYGAVAHPQNDAPSRERDQTELTLLRWILAEKKPLLAICRGCQGLAIASGGTLEQHLPDRSGVLKHKPDSYDDYGRALTNVMHPVTIAAGTKLSEILGTSEVVTNSAHHQAVATLGACLTVAGHTADGVIEMIEHVDRSRFCFGIQSHPEAFEPSFLEPFVCRLF